MSKTVANSQDARGARTHRGSHLPAMLSCVAVAVLAIGSMMLTGCGSGGSSVAPRNARTGTPLPAGALVASFTIPAIQQPLYTGVSVDPVHNRVAVTSIGGETAFFDGATNAVTGIVRTTAQPSVVAINPTTQRTYVTDNGSHTPTATNLAVIGGTPPSVLLYAYPMPGWIPSDVTVNPATNKVYVVEQAADYSSCNMAVLDGATNKMLSNFPVSLLASSSRAAALDPSANLVYVPDYAYGTISVVNGQTDTLQATWSFASLLPGALAVDPQTHRIYALDESNSLVVVLNNAGVAIGQPIPVGAGAVDIAIDPAIGKVYVTNSGDKTLSVISTATNAVLSTLALSKSPFSLAVNPTTHRVTITCGDTIVVLDGTKL